MVILEDYWKVATKSDRSCYLVVKMLASSIFIWLDFVPP